MTPTRFAKAPLAQTLGHLGRETILGVLTGTSVLTLEGALPVEYLSLGDRLVTRDGARRLTGIEVSVVRNARVVRIAPDTLGVGKPHEGVTVAAAQPLVLRDWRAKTLFGATQAVVRAACLTDGAYITAAVLTEARLFKLTFAEPAVIYAGSLELACEGETVRA